MRKAFENITSHGSVKSPARNLLIRLRTEMQRNVQSSSKPKYALSLALGEDEK
jgi:hypothetical protein